MTFSLYSIIRAIKLSRIGGPSSTHRGDYNVLLVKAEGRKKQEDNCLNNTDILKRILKECNFEDLAVHVLII